MKMIEIPTEVLEKYQVKISTTTVSVRLDDLYIAIKVEKITDMFKLETDIWIKTDGATVILWGSKVKVQIII